MNRLLGILAVMVILAGTATAHAEQFMHNGSVMELEWDDEGDGMTVRYVRPRAGLPVRRGTILFEGSSPADGSIYGVAFIFSSTCGPIGYEVRGRFTANGFVLRGDAPVRNDRCRVVRYERNQNSRLEFTNY